MVKNSGLPLPNVLHEYFILNLFFVSEFDLLQIAVNLIINFIDTTL